MLNEVWVREKLGLATDASFQEVQAAITRLLAAKCELRGAVRDLEAFSSLMFGRGPDAIIPETVQSPLGITIQLGMLMREVHAAVRRAESVTDPSTAAL